MGNGIKSKKISAVAKVVRVESNETGTYDIGIFFTKITPEDQKLLIKYVEKS